MDMHYFASKGLFIKKIDDTSYIIEDVFGNKTSPFISKEEDLDQVTQTMANIQKLVKVGITSEFPDYSDFEWDKLEYYYIAHIHYALLGCLLNNNEKERYHKIISLFPIAYLECGYGDGSKSILENIHQEFLKQCNHEKSIIREHDLDIYLITQQVSRICNDITSLLQRSITAYCELLHAHRKSIIKSYQAIEQLETTEIIHTGINSYKSASAITSLVISICTSLDLSAKLIQFINSLDPSNIKYKGARDKQYHEIKKIKSNFISSRTFQSIIQAQEANSKIPEIIQFRNDFIHSTSAIELEKIYVGLGTDEINKIPLYYSAQYARDCLESGQPIRFLSRDYFVEEKNDIEVKALDWLHSIFNYHIEIGKYIHSDLISLRK